MLRIATFLILAIAGLAVVPVINARDRMADPARTVPWHQGFIPWQEGFDAYNLEFALPLYSRMVAPFGISISPEQAVIGKRGWLYLGDQYAEIISRKRAGGLADDDAMAAATLDSHARWRDWLMAQGVRDYRVLLGPNKSTWYPQYLPEWVARGGGRGDGRGGNQRILDLPGADAIFVDGARTFDGQELVPGAELYFRTDTHWNTLAGVLAAQTLLRSVEGVPVKLPRVSQPQHYDRQGGDLANFLRLQTVLRDTDYAFTYGGGPVDTTRIRFDTGAIEGSGGNPHIDSQTTPLLVSNPTAANDLKVLWLRDSFGTALSPYMAAAFSNLMQVHFDKAYAGTGEMLKTLVAEWQPDLVLVTVVERSVLYPVWGTGP